MLCSGAIFFAISVAILLPGPAQADIVSGAEGTAAVDSAAALPLELGEEFFSKLDARNCAELKETAYREISRFVLNDRPDLLHEFVLYWRDRCLTPEPLFRILILGSIWDAGFNEDLYDERVLDHLIDRYDPQVKEKKPELRRQFDEFTTSFADQLLPHVPRRGLEEFFCLYYGGKTETAWAQLRSDDLEDTWLRYYYDQEMAYLNRNDPVPTLMVTGGGGPAVTWSSLATSPWWVS
jgi:hypothetical protein